MSTREQANRHGLDAQKHAMETWCAINNAELVTVHIDVTSTRRTERMYGRAAAVQAVAHGAADALLVRASTGRPAAFSTGHDWSRSARRSGCG